MLLAFYTYEKEIELLGSYDTDFREFFNLPKFTNLLKEFKHSMYNLLDIDSECAQDTYEQFGIFITSSKYEYDRLLYLINTTHEIPSNIMEYEHYVIIKKVLREYKIKQLIDIDTDINEEV